MLEMLESPEERVTPSHEPELEEKRPERNRYIGFIAAAAFLVILAGIVIAIIAMVRSPAQTETIRDIVIIFMAVESLFIGLALFVLMIQLARLSAMIQHEVRPILDSTSETLNTLRGTSQFLSDKMVKPVLKVNSAYSAFRRAVKLITPSRREER